MLNYHLNLYTSTKCEQLLDSRIKQYVKTTGGGVGG